MVISETTGSCPIVEWMPMVCLLVLFFFPSSLLPRRSAGPLDLPQVVVYGQGIHADWHGLGGDAVELLAVGAVLVELVDHLAADAAWPHAGELDNLLCVGGEGVDGSELAATVPEQNHQVVGLTPLQLLALERQTEETTISNHGKKYITLLYSGNQRDI